MQKKASNIRTGGELGYEMDKMLLAFLNWHPQGKDSLRQWGVIEAQPSR